MEATLGQPALHKPFACCRRTSRFGVGRKAQLLLHDPAGLERRFSSRRPNQAHLPCGLALALGLVIGNRNRLRAAQHVAQIVAVGSFAVNVGVQALRGTP